MRIRKHAKISPLHYASSIFLKQHGTVLQSHVNCQLNQSPWDVITFPIEEDINPQNINQQTLLVPHQLDGYDNYAVNGTFYDSEQSITSMKLDDNTEMKEMNYFNNNNVADIDDFKKEQDEEMGELGLEKNGDNKNNVTTIFCCKNDGKGWQCSREAKKGHTLCEHHFAQVKKNYSSSNSAYSTITTANNSDTKINSTPSSRGRPHRPKKSSSSEFYYYSGFGPLWGKKRGPSTGKNNNAGEIYSNDSYGAQSSSSQMDNEGNFDYIEDEDDDDEEVENCQTKRARKPIKARSLKSLM